MKKEIIFLVVISLVAALCPYFYPMEGDDFIYSFTIGDVDKRVENFSDVLDGVANCFRYVNGRTFCNFLVFLFVNLVPQWGMYLLAFVTMLATFLFFERKCSVKNVIPALIFFFWILCPDMEDTLMWKSGFMNYAVPGMLNLLFLWFFSKAKLIRNPYSFFLPFFALLVGSLHEGISLPMCGALAFFCLFNFRGLSKNDLLLIIPYVIGTCLVLFAPGTSVRVGASGGGGLHLMSMIHSLPSMASLILLVVLKWVNRSKSIDDSKAKDLIVIRLFVVFGILFFLLVSVVSGVPEPRYFYFIHLFSVVLVGQEMLKIGFFKKNLSFAIFSVLAIVAVSLSLYKDLQKKQTVDNELKMFASTTDYVVPADITDLRADSSLYSNHLIALYFHKPYLIGYPSDVYYHLYLNEDAPSSSFSEEWKELSPNKFARKITGAESMKDVKVTKVIDLPLLNGKKFVSSRQGDLVKSKSGSYYQVINNDNSYMKIISME